MLCVLITRPPLTSVVKNGRSEGVKLQGENDLTLNFLCGSSSGVKRHCNAVVVDDDDDVNEHSQQSQRRQNPKSWMQGR